MKARSIVLTPEERSDLELIEGRATSAKRDVFRAGVILLAAAGASNEEIARAMKTRPATASKWRGRFLRGRLSGLQDAPRPGKPATYDQGTEQRVLKQLDQPPPKGFARWNGTLLAAALKDVSDDQIWRVLRKHGISLERRRSWCISTDPCFAQKAADVVGLYLNPPENALVLSVDEKPHIQALERAQGWLKLPNGKALTGFQHEYKRHGTTTLFAALEVATGLERVSKIGSASNEVLTCEAVELLSFCHEEATEAVDGRAVGVDWPAVAGGETAQGWARPPSSAESCLFGRHTLDTANRSGMAFSA
ncbi:MAG: IS630 family transposase [Alphaproteobacteria bacterium]|nr:IS630 family transposase [Alphaproteobacteria bacterium]